MEDIEVNSLVNNKPILVNYLLDFTNNLLLFTFIEIANRYVTIKLST